MSQAINAIAQAAATVANVAAPIVAESAKVTKLATKPAKPTNRKTSDNPGKAAFANIAGKAKNQTMVTCGGTDAEPIKVDAADFARVTFKELSASGSTLQNLAYNFLAGTVDASVNVDALKDLPRALRNEKGAITVLLGKTSREIRGAWEAAMVSRKRKDAPTLRTLAALVKGKKAGGATQTWQQKVAAILDGKQSANMKIQMLRELIAD